MRVWGVCLKEMAFGNYTIRPSVERFGQWEGDNLSELQAAFPMYQFEVNDDDSTLMVVSHGFSVPVGDWFAWNRYGSIPNTDFSITFQPVDGDGPFAYPVTDET